MATTVLTQDRCIPAARRLLAVAAAASAALVTTQRGSRASMMLIQPTWHGLHFQECKI